MAGMVIYPDMPPWRPVREMFWTEPYADSWEKLKPATIKRLSQIRILNLEDLLTYDSRQLWHLTKDEVHYDIYDVLMQAERDTYDYSKLSELKSRHG